jgi:aspartate aminotransferase
MPASPIAERVAQNMHAASWIREMFEKGRKLKAELGEDRVYDFSLGNPNATPPEAFFDALSAVAGDRQPALHRYMPNVGLPEARSAVAGMLSHSYGMEFDAESMVLTSGAAGATNVVMRALLNPGDEVIVPAPYFPEYRFYIEQAQGSMVVVETTTDFQLDISAIKAAITPKTRAILVNTPNNPTGAVYSDPDLKTLGQMLSDVDADDRPLYLICDDVYHRLAFDVDPCPVPAAHYSRSIVVSSYSKDISIAGERLGYIALHPELPERGTVMAALTMLNRTLGFVNASALIQRVIARCSAALCDVGMYRDNRDLLCDALTSYGYALTRPGGALYAFPKTPIADDAQFVDALLEHRILAVPGRGFGRAGHMRLSYCVARSTIENALPGFKAAIDAVRG